MAELLLELFSEEIPARMQMPMAENIRNDFAERVKKEGLFVKSVHSYVTPRRIVIIAEGLSITQEDKTEERRGPRADAPQQAIDGFLKSTGLKKSQLEIRKTDKGDFYFGVVHQKGRPTKEVLKSVIESLLANVTWPKSMRWGSYETRWVRPLHNIVCVFGGEVLPVKFGHLTANDNSYGHRFLGPEAFKVREFKQYEMQLARQKVVLDTERRKAKIWEQAQKLAAEHGLFVQQDDGLLEEVAGLVEYPNVMLGSIDKLLMRVPDQVLISSIRTHQKYFVTRDKKGHLAPHFIFVSNMETSDGGKAIIAGNERVLRARLSDAAFFWSQDRRKKLEEWAEGLDKVIFHAKLGTVAEKVERITGLAKLLDVWVPHAHFDLTERAAKICKADLVTGMVGEFPDLQGIMGYYYAKDQGEKEEIALAIKEHYSPLGPNDIIPTAPVSVAIALADKVDTLAGMFTIGEKPTGSKDPYALRRAALGMINIILENKLSLPLKILFDRALHNYPKSIRVTKKDEDNKGILDKLTGGKVKPKELVDELLDFFVDRLKAGLKGRGVRHDLIEAVFDTDHEDDFTRLVKRVEALDNFLKSENGANLLAGYKRASNILRIEEKKDGTTYGGRVNTDVFDQVEEEKLFTAIRDTHDSIKAAVKDNDFVRAMDLLATLRRTVDEFFDEVTVNVENEDIRKNRLVLLAYLRKIFDLVANFEKIDDSIIR